MASRRAVGLDARGMRAMFDRVPRTYELVNHVITLGMDMVWRQVSVLEAVRGDERVCLDICTGTGETAGLLRGAAPISALVVGLDFSRSMIRHAAAARGRIRISWACGRIPTLPVASGAVDLVTVTFATRNLQLSPGGLVGAFAEMRRVLRPGGRLVLLETSQPPNALIRMGFRAYVRAVVPLVGGTLARTAGPYAYLSRSILQFRGARDLSAALVEAGFRIVSGRLFWGGVAALNIAER